MKRCTAYGRRGLFVQLDNQVGERHNYMTKQLSVVVFTRAACIRGKTY